MPARFPVTTLLAALLLPFSATVGQTRSLLVSTDPAVFRPGSKVAVQVTIKTPENFSDARLDLSVADGKKATLLHSYNKAPEHIGPLVANQTTVHTFATKVQTPAAPSGMLRFSVWLMKGNEPFIGENAGAYTGTQIYASECTGGSVQSAKKVLVSCFYKAVTASPRPPR